MSDCEIVEEDSARVFASQIGIECKTHGARASVNEMPDQCWKARRQQGDDE